VLNQVVYIMTTGRLRVEIISAMKTYEGEKIQIHVFSAKASGCSEWLASNPS
jgi:hypothetical protein